MARLQQNFLGGQLDLDLAADGTILSSPALVAMVQVDGDDTMDIVLDPAGRGGGPPEIATVIFHAGGSAVAEILRGQEGTTARAHRRFTRWRQGPTAGWASELQGALTEIDGGTP